VVEKQRLDGVWWLMLAEIDHHRHIGQSPGSNGTSKS
jgi:hypothetical protein